MPTVLNENLSVIPIPINANKPDKASVGIINF